MLRLLQLEYYKNLNYRPFKVFSILYFLLLAALLFIGLVDFNLFENTVNLKKEGIYNFPEIWNFCTYIVSLLKIFLGMILVFAICQEFTNRMFKQNTIDGLSRKEFIASKILTTTVFTLVSTLIVLLITLFLGYTYAENTDSKLITKELFFIGNYFVKLFVFFSFLIFLSVLLRKSIFVFLAFFVWWIIENIIGGVESYFKIKNIDMTAKEEMAKVIDGFYFSKLLPLESMSSLIPFPMTRLNTLKMFGLEYKFTYPTESLIACVVWGIIFILGSYYILKKRDW